LFWFGTGGMGKRVAGCVSPYDPGGGDRTLHNGPISEYEVFFDCCGGLDCARSSATKIPACLVLACRNGPPASADDRIRRCLCRAIDMAAAPPISSSCRHYSDDVAADGDVPSGERRISAGTGQPLVFFSAALGVV